MAALKRTPLHALHQKYGARMVEFGGWEMPVQYTGIMDEHRAVRTASGLFDVSHMGEFEFAGDQAGELLNYLVTNDVSKLEIGQALYSPMCYESGTVVDDVLIYRLGPARYMMVVNAGNIDKDWAWVDSKREERFPGVIVRNQSDQIGLLALQGPAAQAVLQPLTRTDLNAIGFYRFADRAQVAGVQVLALSRTGYTGEDGFEIYCRAEDCAMLWDALLEAGGDEVEAPVPCGLGARDTLRFEACLPLYGHEIDETTSPLEAGLGRFVKLNKGDFCGREVLQAQKEGGLGRKLIGFEMVDRGIPRQGYDLYAGDQAVGRVTSGTHCPTLGKPMGLGYLPVALAEPGTEFTVGIRQQQARARVVQRPFYKRAPASGPVS